MAQKYKLHEDYLTAADPVKDVARYLAFRAPHEVARYPEPDSAPIGPKLDLIEAKKLNALTKIKVQFKGDIFRAARKDMDTQWLQLEERERELKDTFNKFNKFIKKNFEKRERSVKSIEGDRLLYQKREIDVLDLQKSYNKMLECRNNLDIHLKKHKFYEEFMNTVVDHEAEFTFREDVLKKYETLVEAAEKLLERQTEILAEILGARCDMDKLIEVKQMVILGLHNYLANLECRYEIAVEKSRQMETIVVNVKMAHSHMQCVLKEAEQDTANIYKQICRRQNIEAKRIKSDVLNRLLAIKQSLAGFEEVKRRFDEAMKKETKIKNKSDVTV